MSPVAGRRTPVPIGVRASRFPFDMRTLAALCQRPPSVPNEPRQSRARPLRHPRSAHNVRRYPPELRRPRSSGSSDEQDPHCLDPGECSAQVLARPAMHFGNSPDGSLGWRGSCCSCASPAVHRTKVVAPNPLDGAECDGTAPAKRRAGSARCARNRVFDAPTGR